MGELYDTAVAQFSSELRAIPLVGREELEEVVGPEVADIIVRIRRGNVEITPGYGGVYGRLSLRPRSRGGRLDEFFARGRW